MSQCTPPATPLRIAICLLLVTAAATMPLRAQVELTGRIKALDGQWKRDASRGIETCGATIDESIRVHVSPSEVRIESSQQISPLSAVVRLDGGVSTPSNGRTATASLDGGWLLVTVRRQLPTQANVWRHAYVLGAGGDELIVWSSLNVEYPDGTLGHIGCGNRRAIVYRREK